MSLRDKIENHLGLVIGGFVVTGFVAGFSAYGVIQSISPVNNVQQTADADWEQVARQQGWVPKGECPAFPISLSISSPGDQSTVDASRGLSEWYINADLVVRSAHPIPDSMDIGYIVAEEGSGNFYVKFPFFHATDDRTVFRAEKTFSAPLSVSGQSALKLWAFAVEDQNSLGSVYASLEQITSSDDSVVLSPMIAIRPRVVED